MNLIFRRKAAAKKTPTTTGKSAYLCLKHQNQKQIYFERKKKYVKLI